LFTRTRLGGCFLLALLCTAAGSAQQNGPLTRPGNGKICLDVVVTRQSGPATSGLKQQDFTVLDNKAPQTITSFKAVTRREAQLNVTVVVDEVNADYQEVAYERTQIDQFLCADGGHLAYPVALAALTTNGITVGNFSMDGNALSAALDRNQLALRAVTRSTGYYSAFERWQLSLHALTQLVRSTGHLPGRKVILWVSPGWPLPSGTYLDSKQQRQMFTNVVILSSQLLQDHITIYSIDPVSIAGSPGRELDYEWFLKGISKPSQAQAGDLALQVLAIQSGGLALGPGDVAGLLHQCLSEVVPYYEICFNAPGAKRPDEYHHLEIKLANHDLTAHTRQGYYAQP
jgi:VWFA-related protein